MFRGTWQISNGRLVKEVMEVTDHIKTLDEFAKHDYSLLNTLTQIHSLPAMVTMTRAKCSQVTMCQLLRPH